MRHVAVGVLGAAVVAAGITATGYAVTRSGPSPAPSYSIGPATAITRPAVPDIVIRAEFPNPNGGPVDVEHVHVSRITVECVQRPGVDRIHDHAGRVGYVTATDLPPGSTAGLRACDGRTVVG